VRRLADFPRRLPASLVVLGALVLAARAAADEVPLPGPVLEDQTPRPAAKEAASEPLWEIGLGVAAVRFDDYRGSDQTNVYVLPLPFVAYRGRFLRADRDGARAILFAGYRMVVDVSLAASVPNRSSGNVARQGMPDLAATVEIGPSLNVELWQSSNRSYKLDLRLPVREAITFERSPRTVGATFSPHLNLDVRDFAGHGNLGFLAGPLFAVERYHAYFYSVPPQFATDSRPAYSAPGGYAGWRATTAFSRRLGNAWLGGFVRYDDLHGAAFAPSPLVRREHTITAGFGISWIFATSSQRVPAAD
jgi:outer membrane scaffolding protein for murein synthesis (MipA/OmpV family)